VAAFCLGFCGRGIATAAAAAAAAKRRVKRQQIQQRGKGWCLAAASYCVTSPLCTISAELAAVEA
jgi:hypothetical protein